MKINNFSDLFSLSGASLVSQFSFILFAPILYRLYDTFDFGVLAIFTAIGSSLVVFTHFQYNQSIILQHDNRRALNIIRGILLITLVFTLIIFFIFFLFGNHLESLFNLPDNQTLLFLLIPLILFLSLNEVLKQWASRLKYYKVISLSIVSIAILNQLLSLIFFYLGIKSFGLIYSYILSQFIGASIIFYFFYKSEKNFFHGWEFSKIIYDLKSNFDFVKYNLPSEFVNRFITQIPVIGLGIYANNSVVGAYDLSFKVLNIPFKITNSSIGEIFKRNAVEENMTKKNYSKIFTNNFLSLTAISLSFLFFILVFSDFLFLYAFGEKWLEASQISKIIIWFISVKMIASPLSYSFFINNKLFEDFLIHFYLLISSIIIFVIAFELINTNYIISLWIYSFNFMIIYVYTLYRSYLFSKG